MDEVIKIATEIIQFNLNSGDSILKSCSENSVEMRKKFFSFVYSKFISF